VNELFRNRVERFFVCLSRALFGHDDTAFRVLASFPTVHTTVLSVPLCFVFSLRSSQSEPVYGSGVLVGRAASFSLFA